MTESPFVGAFSAVAIIYAATFIFNGMLPGIKVLGYVIDQHNVRSRYTLNGVRVLLFTVALASAACRSDPLSLDSIFDFKSAAFLYEIFGYTLVASCTLGLLLSLILYVRGTTRIAVGGIDKGSRCATWERQPGPPTFAKLASTSEFESRNIVQHFYCGLSEFNPRIIGVDIKMWLYVVGAVMLQLNLLSFVAAHMLARQVPADTNVISSGISSGVFVDLGSLGVFTISYAMAAYAFCLTFFIVEYMLNEEVHLYTYDLFRERVGLKLVWGCMCFYPFFYIIGGYPLVQTTSPSDDMSATTAALCVALFFSGWVLTRGANMQKFACKQGQDTFLWGLVPMTTVPGSNGRLLCSGFWSLSRHINYCGESLQAVALALPAYLATGSFISWLYPLYYVALFIPRQIDDDSMCKDKYGKVWTEYCKRVPWRIVPYVY